MTAPEQHSLSLPRTTRVGICVVLTLALAAVGLFLATVESLGPAPTLGEPAPQNVRDAQLRPGKHATLLVERGQVVDADVAERIAIWSAQPARRWPHRLALGVALLVLAGGVLALVSRQAWGQRQRNLLTWLALLLCGLLVTRLVLSTTAASFFAVPAAAFAVLGAERRDLITNAALALLTAAMFAVLVPLQSGVFAILLAQTTIAALLSAATRSTLQRAAACVLGGAAAALVLTLWSTALSGDNPLTTLGDPLRSPMLAVLGAGVLSGLLSSLLAPVAAWLAGYGRPGQIAALDNLAHPLLRRLAERAPGSWQHSLAVAQLAERAGHAIGADVRLLRVGAYFHDIGKGHEPNYFVENLTGGQPSPHDHLEASASCSGIFFHVTEGLQRAQEARLPAAIVDFIVSHHARAHLEYFWAKARQRATPAGERERYRYPGLLPQTRETGILCICDAVEAAARRLDGPTEAEIEQLVHLVVYGKCQSGQLEHSGLSLRDLQDITSSLIDTLQLAHRAPNDDARTGPTTSPGRPAARVTRGPTLRMGALRLDGLDLPRPDWGLRRGGAEPSPEVEVAPRTDPSEPVRARQDRGRSGEDEELERRRTEQRTIQLRPRITSSVSEDEILDELSVAQTPPPPVSEWEEALSATASDIEALAPPMGGREFSLDPDEAMDVGNGLVGRRAPSEDGLDPGMVVVGAPPATHPERAQTWSEVDSSAHTEVTALRVIRVPPEAHRPDGLRPTREHPTQVPPEALPEVTVPRARRAPTDDD